MTAARPSLKECSPLWSRCNLLDALFLCSYNHDAQSCPHVTDAMAQAASTPSVLPSTPPIEAAEWPHSRSQPPVSNSPTDFVRHPGVLRQRLVTQDSGYCILSSFPGASHNVDHGFDSNDSILETSDDDWGLDAELTGLQASRSRHHPTSSLRPSSWTPSRTQPTNSRAPYARRSRQQATSRRRSLPDDSDDSDADIDRRPPSSRRRKSSSDSSPDERHAESAPPLAGPLLRKPVQPVGNLLQIPIPTVHPPSLGVAPEPEPASSPLHWSATELKGFRDSLLQEARAAGFDRRQWRNPHWVYIRWMMSDAVTVTNTLRNQELMQGYRPSPGGRRLRRLPSAPTISPLRTSVAATPVVDKEWSPVRSRKRSASLATPCGEPEPDGELPPSPVQRPHIEHSTAIALHAARLLLPSPATSSAPSVTSSLDSRDHTLLLTGMAAASLEDSVPDAFPALPPSPPLNVAQALLQRHRRVSRQTQSAGSLPPAPRRRRFWFGPDVYHRDLAKLVRGQEAARPLGPHHPVCQALARKVSILTKQLERCLQRVERERRLRSSFQIVSSTSDLSQPTSSLPSSPQHGESLVTDVSILKRFE